MTVSAVMAAVIALLMGTAACTHRPEQSATKAPVTREAQPEEGQRKATPRARDGNLRILQIGDSHTAADFFTGEARRVLQARFGNGGPGYIEAGRPHAGVRHSAVTVSASRGWAYSSLRKPSDNEAFGLSGFNATAKRAGETITVSTETPIPSGPVEIEAMSGPGQGVIEVSIDDQKPVRHSLEAARQGRFVVKVPVGPQGTLTRVGIRTASDAPVTVSGISLLDRTQGLSYSRVGFPGATVDVINRMDPKALAADLKRLDPSIVVIAFGTNEGFDDGLDLEEYAARYEEALGKVRAALPKARVVLIAPPHANRVKGRAKDTACGSPTPPKLDRVRSAVLDIGKRQKLPVWDWSSVMPGRCGPAQWAAANPRLMASDRVHLTRAGYELSARSFANFLEPLIAQASR